MLGIFGGAFDPPHLGHLLAAIYALTMDERLGGIVMVPTVHHPWKPDLKTPLKDRAAMLRLLIQPLGERFGLCIDVDDQIEAAVAKKKPNEPVYTIDVVEEYQARDRRVVLVVGEDEARDLPRWHCYDDLMELAGPPCVVPRGCTKSVHVCDVSSTAVRELLIRGRFEEAEAFVPKRILSYIEAHRLYMTSKWARTRG